MILFHQTKINLYRRGQRLKAKIELGNIQVTSMDTSSGIFISQLNFANGWRSQIKSNSGFGEIGDHNHLENCIFAVSDDDIIDSPMEDNSVSMEMNIDTGESESSIQFKGIEVDSLNQNASISIGENRQSGWASASKENEGNGDFLGETLFVNNQTLVRDNDFIDAPVIDKHITISRPE